MKRSSSFLVFIPVLAACVPSVPPNPIVSEYNKASVTIVTSSLSDLAEANKAAQAEAERICRTGGAKRAEYASTRFNPTTYENSNLYLCL